MNIVIAGGRDFTDYSYLLDSILTYLNSNYVLDPSDVTVITGGAKGADACGERFAADCMTYLKKFPAEWDKYGKSAGYRLNVEMADNADLVIVFWDGKSRGSKHMIDIAESKSVPVKVFNY